MSIANDEFELYCTRHVHPVRKRQTHFVDISVGDARRALSVGLLFWLTVTTSIAVAQQNGPPPPAGEDYENTILTSAECFKRYPNRFSGADVACQRERTKKCLAWVKSLPITPEGEKIFEKYFQSKNDKCNRQDLPLLLSPDPSHLLIDESAYGAEIGAKALQFSELRKKVQLSNCMARLDAIPIAVGSSRTMKELKCQDGDWILFEDFEKKYASKLKQITAIEAEAQEREKANALIKYAPKIKELGFSQEFLRGTIFLKTIIRPPKYDTFQVWLTNVYATEKYTRISRITHGRYQGILLKRPGAPSYGVLFRFEDGDIFPVHTTDGETVPVKNTLKEEVTASTTVMYAADKDVPC